MSGNRIEEFRTGASSSSRDSDHPASLHCHVHERRIAVATVEHNAKIGRRPQKDRCHIGGGLALMDHNRKFAGMRQFELAFKLVHWTDLLSVVQ